MSWGMTPVPGGWGCPKVRELDPENYSQKFLYSDLGNSAGLRPALDMIKVMPLFLFFELVGKALILLAIGLQLYASFLNNMRQDIQHELTRDTLSLRLPITKQWLDGEPEPVVPAARRSSYESVKTEERYLQMMIDRSIFADAPLVVRYSTYWFYVFAIGSIFTLFGTFLEKRKKYA